MCRDLSASNSTGKHLNKSRARPVGRANNKILETMISMLNESTIFSLIIITTCAIYYVGVILEKIYSGSRDSHCHVPKMCMYMFKYIHTFAF